MKIAVIGAGAIGSVVAGYLHEKSQDVALIGYEDQVRAIQSKGLLIKGIDGEKRFSIPVFTRLNEVCDLVIFTVKSQDLDQAYEDNREFLNKGEVLTAQNGVQADNILRKHFEPQRMYSSIVMFGATFIKPGEVTYNFKGDWILGKPFGPVDAPLHKIAETLKTAFPVVVTDDITGMKWLKLFVNFNNCIPALVGKSMQETFSDMDLCRLSILLLREGFDVVTKSGRKLVSLPQFPAERITGLVHMPVDQAASIIHKTLTTLSKEPLYGSILQSIMRGRESEIDFINGEVVHIAAQIHAEAPLNTKVVDLVHQVERNKKFFTVNDIKQAFSLNEAAFTERE